MLGHARTAASVATVTSLESEPMSPCLRLLQPHPFGRRVAQAAFCGYSVFRWRCTASLLFGHAADPAAIPPAVQREVQQDADGVGDGFRGVVRHLRALAMQAALDSTTAGARGLLRGAADDSSGPGEGTPPGRREAPARPSAAVRCVLEAMAAVDVYHRDVVQRVRRLQAQGAQGAVQHQWHALLKHVAAPTDPAANPGERTRETGGGSSAVVVVRQSDTSLAYGL